ncbi:hypothetical protein J4457_06400 [Candidatus Woesearchaeota archaeon]|nr:hypothetical protein [Candidatus Woesearchaeota archaeon]
MGTLTINVNNETLDRFRKTVQIKFGTEKGVLGRAIGQALNSWLAEMQQMEIAQRQKNWIEKGFHLGKLGKWNREELYGRDY